MARVWIAQRTSRTAWTDEDRAMSTIRKGPFSSAHEAYTELADMITEEVHFAWQRGAKLSDNIEFKVIDWEKES